MKGSEKLAVKRGRGRKNKAEFQKSDMAGKFLSIFTKLSENDQKSVIVLLEEMKRH